MESSRRRGSVLLLVMWVAAALAVIALAAASTMRGEYERMSTQTEALRTQQLAAAAVERGILYMLWGPVGPVMPDGSPRYFRPGMARFQFGFPTGLAQVDIVPENAKMNVNNTPPQELLKLFVNMGIDPAPAGDLVAAIMDWRTPMPGLTAFDGFYLQNIPSFRARHASLEEIEELLLVRGMTPDLFYGSYSRDPEGRLIPRAGLRDCLSVYGTTGPVDVNYAEPAVLATVGVPANVIAAIVERRRAIPFRNMAEMGASGVMGPWNARLTMGGSTMFTLRANARLFRGSGQLSDLSRTVSALIKFREPNYYPPVEIVRWYE